MDKPTQYSLNTSDLHNLVLNITMTNITTEADIAKMLRQALGEPRRDPDLLILLTVVYAIIFITGTVGNICTCIVIARTSSMHTTTNFYLFSLAMSDLLLLCFGLPTELYTIWEAYPWRLGVVFCYLRHTFLEATSYASVLTITAFTVERYVAICRPLLAYKMATLSRATKIIIAIWIISLVSALPYAIHTRTYYKVRIPHTNKPVRDSYICSIHPKFLNGFMYYMFQISTFLFFIIPITIIIILYILIGLALRRSSAIQNRLGDRDKRKLGYDTANHKSSYSATSGGSSGTQSRRVIIRMLVSVTIAFIICWAPFHGQRLMVLYITHWTPALHTVQTHIFDVSGVLYFVSSTANPILYSLISKRYRAALRKTILPCLKTKQTINTNALSNIRSQGYPSASINRSPGLDNKHTRQQHPNHSPINKGQSTNETRSCNGRAGTPTPRSQAMVVMKNDSTSLKLIFRKDPLQCMNSYETIPLTSSIRSSTGNRTFND